MKRPLNHQLEITIEWRQSNEGEIEEHTACKETAEWLQHLLLEAHIKAVAKEKGVKPKVIRNIVRRGVRKAYKEAKKKQSQEQKPA